VYLCEQILRRSGPAEQVLVLTRRRHGHHCQHAVMVVGVCVWDALEQNYATELYDYLCQVLPDNAEPTERRCGWNDRSVHEWLLQSVNKLSRCLLLEAQS